MNRSRFRYWICGLVFGVGAMVAPTGNAQSVNGTVVGPDQRPVGGAVIELLDATSTAVAHVVASSTGAFSVRAPVAGRYQVRARQLGWRPVLSAILELRADATETVRLTFVGSLTSLDTIRVAGRAVCGRASDSTQSVVTALEYARTTLLGSDVRRARGFTFTSLQYSQVLDPVRERVLSQITRVQVDSSAQPWVSSPIDALRRQGYVVPGAGDSTVYRLPGLDMLASAAFVDDHCFEFNKKSDKKRIGVSFEPTPARRKLVDIRGTMWLDRTTAALQSLEFRYTNLEGAQDEARPGGDMRFERLSDGTWAVTQWTVRMARLERRLPKAVPGARIGSGVPETVIGNILLTGGQIGVVTAAGAARGMIDTLWSRPGLTVAGIVIDSVSNKPAVGARVEVIGTALRATSDADGRFSIAGILPGEYTVAVRTASLDSVRAATMTQLTVTSAAPRPLELKAADARGVVALLCPLAPRGVDTDRGVLVGQVLGDSLTAVATSRVSFEWPTEPAGALQWIASRTADDGTFRACGLPLDKPITVRALSPRAGAVPRTVTIPASTRFASTEVTLDVSRVESAVFTGLVTSEGGAKPIADAEVAIPALNRTVRTNSDGRFRLGDLPAGTHRVLVRKLGFGPLDTPLQFEARETVDRRIILGSVTLLDSVITIAERPDPAMRDFEENRRLGIGKFMTRADLDRQKTATMNEVFMTVNGLQVKSLNGHRFVSSGRRGYGGGNHCYYFEGLDTMSTCLITSECFAQLWLDNRPLFMGRDGETVPDLSRYRPEDLEGVEVYASAMLTPSRYMGDRGSCGGVVVLHRRRSK